MRWHVAHDTVGHGHLYQGRFKSFPIQADEHFLTVREKKVSELFIK
jgi:putative transposase